MSEWWNETSCSSVLPKNTGRESGLSGGIKTLLFIKPKYHVRNTSCPNLAQTSEKSVNERYGAEHYSRIFGFVIISYRTLWQKSCRLVAVGCRQTSPSLLFLSTNWWMIDVNLVICVFIFTLAGPVSRNWAFLQERQEVKTSLSPQKSLLSYCCSPAQLFGLCIFKSWFLNWKFTWKTRKSTLVQSLTTFASWILLLQFFATLVQFYAVTVGVYEGTSNSNQN